MRMETRGVVTVAVVLCGLAGSVLSATLPSSISREPLTVGRVSDRLSIGVGYERIERGIVLDGGLAAILEADALSGYAGFDVLPWLTVFVTAGSVELEKEEDLDTDAGLKISAGASAYLWEGDVLVPAFMSGRLSIKAMAEVSSFESDTDVGTVDWVEVMAALPIGYEKFDNYPASSSGLQTSLALYAGPAVSSVQGNVGSVTGDKDFEEDELVGAVVGADVYFAPQVSIGVKAMIFDEISYGATARFHF